METPSTFPTGLLRKWAGSLAMFGLFLFITFRRAWLSTHDLKWPFDIDLFRDSAFAHSVLVGKFPEDPYYVGVQNWYNPLSAFLVAATAKLFSIDPVHVHSRWGSLLALPIPIAIFLLGIALFGRWPAVCAIFAFLFLHVELPTWVSPTYSPWLFANNIALVPMAVCIILALRARTAPGVLPWIACGAALGVTFLGHTAAAVIAGSVAVAVGFTRDWLVTLRRYAALLITAFIVGLPFAVSILFHYRLHIKNDASLVWLWDETVLANLPALFRGSLNLQNAIAAGGFVVLLRTRSLVGPRRVIFTWLGVAGGLLAYSFFRQTVPSLPLPGLIPPYHWLFQIRVVRALLFGFALYGGLAAAASFVQSRLRISSPATGAPVAACAILLGLLAYNYERYAGLFDNAAERGVSLSYSAKEGFAGTIDWLRANTPADAVILADPENAEIMVGAAYRHAVVVDPNFSNPYVPLQDRVQAAEGMFAALASADAAGFRASAAEYAPGYILLADVAAPDDPRLAAPFVTVAYKSGSYAVLRVNPAQ